MCQRFVKILKPGSLHRCEPELLMENIPSARVRSMRKTCGFLDPRDLTVQFRNCPNTVLSAIASTKLRPSESRRTTPTISMSESLAKYFAHNFHAHDRAPPSLHLHR